MASILLAFFPAFFGWIQVPGTAAAQTATADGTMLGIITDEEGNEVITDAVVHLRNTSTGELLESQPSDELGMYVLRNIPLATYDLAVETERGFYLTPEPVVIFQDVPLVVSIALKEDDAAAALVKSAAFWKTPAGIAVIVAGALAAGFIVNETFGDDDEETPESPENP